MEPKYAGSFVLCTIALRPTGSQARAFPWEPLSDSKTELCTAHPLPGHSKGISYAPALCLVMSTRPGKQGLQWPRGWAWAETLTVLAGFTSSFGSLEIPARWGWPWPFTRTAFLDSCHSSSETLSILIPVLDLQEEVCHLLPHGARSGSFSLISVLFLFWQGKIFSAQPQEAIAWAFSTPQYGLLLCWNVATVSLETFPETQEESPLSCVHLGG